jgi:DNA-binding HxlR family transcriptional regulator
MPHGQPPAISIAKVISKAHRMDVLRALLRSSNGLSYTEIDRRIVGNSGTNLVLNDLAAAHLVVWNERRYQITPEGRKAVSAFDALESVGGSNGKGGAGVPR